MPKGAQLIAVSIKEKQIEIEIIELIKTINDRKTPGLSFFFAFKEKLIALNVKRININRGNNPIA
tara:strand:- start:465 stop:659 length:195 start_codon:yes stop_codon:yes gene_type:complete